MSDWKSKRRAEGWADKLIWLRPDAVKALAELKLVYPGDSDGDLLSRAVVNLVGHLDVPTPSTEEPTILARLEALEEAMRGLVAGKVKPVHSTARQGTGRKGAHYAEQVDMTARRIVRDGETFSQKALWQDMQDAGISSHGAPTAFWNWFNTPRNQAAIKARIEELRAGAVSPQDLPW